MGVSYLFHVTNSFKKEKCVLNPLYHVLPNTTLDVLKSFASKTSSPKQTTAVNVLYKYATI